MSHGCAAATWELAIQDHDIRLLDRDLAQRLLCVSGFAYDLDVGRLLKQDAQPDSKGRVIVNQDDANGSFHGQPLFYCIKSRSNSSAAFVIWPARSARLNGSQACEPERSRSMNQQSA